MFAEKIWFKSLATCYHVQTPESHLSHYRYLNQPFADASGEVCKPQHAWDLNVKGLFSPERQLHFREELTHPHAPGL
ncbi:hypothetical protein Y1Q_0002446 [Alligator mississippiensis]|uniref:Uncharacterized protein n=1 Tax=Alligator mississippiensis TaxID=8496 RepID=A0A151NYC6_ALLMI|nr:hypothetical protein Y1Q_0002446 [Alligator mississippiensis]